MDNQVAPVMGAAESFSALSAQERALLTEIAALGELPTGAFSLRRNGQGAIRQSAPGVEIRAKTDCPGIDILVEPGIRGQTIYIPVVVTQPGVQDLVYNDFYIGQGADVLIVAGCGIHNGGTEESRHDGIHRIHLARDAKLRYLEKHYGAGEGTGGRVLNPVTQVEQEAGSTCEMELVQIAGVDHTLRTTQAHLGPGAKMIITERLLTQGSQQAVSQVDIFLEGDGSSAQIISRSVGQQQSVQEFRINAVGSAACQAHVQCDSIIMDGARISSIPAITAQHPDAQVVHEAAIGRINSDQLLKLQSFGLTAEEAEEVIIQGFLK